MKRWNWYAAAIASLLTFCLTSTPVGADSTNIASPETAADFALSRATAVNYLICEDGKQVTETVTDYEIVDENNTDWDNGWYVVVSDTTISGRAVVNGEVNLILADGAVLTISEGITVQGNNSLAIYAQSEGENMGTLVAGEEGYIPRMVAGIGGNASDGGNIAVYGGMVMATGGIGGAGIGGGEYGNAGIITIYGGRVNANGGGFAAGIGGGVGSTYDSDVGNGGSVTISGGTVTANGGYAGAGIGGGSEGNGGNITITGGTVTATGGSDSAGIGGGDNGDGGKITISNGTVTATGGGQYGAGIGGGDIGDGGNIIISGGTIAATGGPFSAAGIGGGDFGAGGNIVISNGTITAKGGIYGAGIGSGRDCTGGTITINGGTIVANGGDGFGAGIGGGYGGDGGDITISDGAIIANGGVFAAGIGGGGSGDGISVTITGGTVTANGGGYGAGIGGGHSGDGGYITISGGIIMAQGGTERDSTDDSTANIAETGANSVAGIGGGMNGTSGSFTTGEDGKALIYTGSISDTTQKDNWSGIIFVGNVGQVYKDQVLSIDLTVVADQTLIVPEEITLTVPETGKLTVETDATLKLDGVLQVNGDRILSGRLTGSGEITPYEKKLEAELNITKIPENYYTWETFSPDSVQYTYTGNAESVTFIWCNDNNGQPGEQLSCVPDKEGHYWIQVCAPVTGFYQAAESVPMAFIVVGEKTITVSGQDNHSQNDSSVTVQDTEDRHPIQNNRESVGIPETADEDALELWLGMLILACLGVAGVVILHRSIYR